MAYKLGTAKQAYSTGGEIKNKFSFLKSDVSVPGTPVIIQQLQPGVVAEANMDGSVFLSDKADPNSWYTRYTLNHEMIHATAMKISKNKLAYTDDTVTYEGNIYPRKDIDGKDMIQDIETGQWKEAGDHTWPWEEDANILTSDPEIKQ